MIASMTDHPRIPLAGVIGHPIAHSRSPALHGYWLKRYGIKGHYIPIDMCAQSTCRDADPHACRELGFVGCNVTIPHKEADPADRRHRHRPRGADRGGQHADLPQGRQDPRRQYRRLGLHRQPAPECARTGCPPSGPAVVLGAGGAARAVVAALIEVGVPEIRLANRTRARAEALRSDFGAKVHVHDWVQAGNMLEDAATVVNTTSLGMTGKPDFRVPLDAAEPARAGHRPCLHAAEDPASDRGRGAWLHRRRRAGHAAAPGRPRV